MATILRAADRWLTDQAGIRSWHSFSSGPHYDPDNVSFGPVIGCDEHLVQPGAGFDWHAHRGVVIVSWVLEGVLRHEDDGGGPARDVGAGDVLIQSTGGGIRHRETNASADEQLRFVQTTLLLDDGVWVDEPALPVHVNAVGIDLVTGSRQAERAFVLAGADASVGGESLERGDTMRLEAQRVVTGPALVIDFAA